MIFLGRIVNTTQNQCRMKYADTELKVGKDCWYGNLVRRRRKRRFEQLKKKTYILIYA